MIFLPRGYGPAEMFPGCSRPAGRGRWLGIKFREQRSADRYIGRLRAREKAEDDQQMQSIMDRETFRCAIETSFRVGENYSRARSRLAPVHNLLFM